MKATFSVRTHIILSKDLLFAIDKIVGKRERSAFIASAATDKLRQIELLHSARKAAGIFKNKTIKGWETEESSRRWINALRKSNDKRV